MKKLLVAALISGPGLLATPKAKAQAAPDFPTSGQQTPANSEAGARRNTRTNADELARQQRQAAMSPDERQRDQQLQVLEARTGMVTNNTSYGRSGPDRQFDSSRGGGFKVKKFKPKKGMGEQKRGISRSVARGADPQGERLIDKKRKKFLFF
ncbi:hypothetical protein GCM10023185_08660 [Hymenobacter saemangeumensis]|uniref:DUF4890 domain-containing protein n=1 Tax=Hymenobacter saemangeumensis TaxID=1084522 RepID=A0ABP8I3K2_9BACT